MGAAFGLVIKAIGTAVTLKGVITALIKVVLVNVLMGALNKSKHRRPKDLIPPINVTVRNPVEARRILFGKQRVGGSIVFFGSSGANKEKLSYVVAFAGFTADDLSNVWR